jgi:hypothetical protein
MSPESTAPFSSLRAESPGKIGLGLDPRGNIATVTFDGTVIGAINPQLVRQVQRFVELNGAVLLDYWLYRIDTDQLRQRLQSI